jgi:alpha-methylacyl-CoA racemase
MKRRSQRLPLAGVLNGVCVVTLAGNVPGPVAAARLRDLGASVVKVEPPGGDPLAAAKPEWYEELTSGQARLRLDLKTPTDRGSLDTLLSRADLLITATRPAALARLGLDWRELHQRHPRLAQVAIFGYAEPEQDRAGHDLTFQAAAGLVRPPELPLTLVADLAAAERAVSAALALLLARERSGEARYAQVTIAESITDFATPLRHGLTAPGGLLGGGLPLYRVYAAAQGWVALAALEAHFRERFQRALGLETADHEALQRLFLTRSAAEWEAWAIQHDLPLARVTVPPQR